tara:strand:+ start:491 stop:754 length:264 start_codon:yes stop_codon:yes gene_type:complete
MNFNQKTFSASPPTGKNGTKAYSWTHKWAVQTVDTKGQWCYYKNNLPANYSGGLILTHKNDANTRAAAYLKSSIADRYFDDKTLTSA